MFQERTEQTVEPMLLTARQAAKVLSISERTLFTLTSGEVKKQGKVIKVIPVDQRIPAVRFGRAVRYDPTDIRAWIASAKKSQNLS